MTKQEKQRLSAVLRVTEYLFLENLALKLVLEHREVANWQKLLDHLLADKEILAGARLWMHSWGGLSAPKKPH